MPRQKSSKNPDSQNVYIGLDVHLRLWNVCIYQGGIARKPFQQSPSASVLLAHLKAHYPEMNYYSAYEAGVCGCSVHYELLAAGIENIIFNAADISQTHKERVRKTDAVDAAKIARSLAYGELRCIHIPPKWRLDDRNLLRLRSALVSDMKRLKSRLRHYLHVNGITIPPEFQPRRWPLAFIKWLKKTAIDNNNTTGSTLAMMVDKIENAVTELKNIDKLLLAMMKEKRYKSDYQLLRSIRASEHRLPQLSCWNAEIWPTSARLTHFAHLSDSSLTSTARTNMTASAASRGATTECCVICSPNVPGVQSVRIHICPDYMPDIADGCRQQRLS